MVRLKNRYICFELKSGIVSETKDLSTKQLGINIYSPLGTVSTKTLSALIREHVSLNFGDSGAGRVLGGLHLKHFGQRTQLGIIKVPRDHCKMVLSTLALISHIQKQPCTVCIRHVSGTIKKCQRAAIRADRELIISWYKKQQALLKAGAAPVANDRPLAEMLKQSESTISSLEL